MDTNVKQRLLFIPQNYHVDPKPHLEWLIEFGSLFECDYYCGFMSNYSKYDFIFVQSGATDAETLRKLKAQTGAKVIQWTGDCRDEPLTGVIEYKGIADLTLLAVGIGQKEMYENYLEHEVGYLQQGVFNEFFMLPKQLQRGKCVFIGNNYDHFAGAVERTKLCELLSIGSDFFEVIGNGYNMAPFNNSRSIPYIDSANIYNEAYISISHACFNEIEGYYSNRTLDIMASGGCCLMRYVPNAERYFTDMEDVVFYKTNTEAIEKMQFLMQNPEIRNKIAMNGHIKAGNYHTFYYRVREINEYIEKLKK